MPTPTRTRVQKRREALRAAGLRPVQIWVPDTRAGSFADECRRQVRRVAASERDDRELAGMLDGALSDLLDDDG